MDLFFLQGYGKHLTFFNRSYGRWDLCIRKRSPMTEEDSSRCQCFAHVQFALTISAYSWRKHQQLSIELFLSLWMGHDWSSSINISSLPRTVGVRGHLLSFYHSFFYPWVDKLWAPVMQMDWGPHNSWVSCSIINNVLVHFLPCLIFSLLYQGFQVLESSSTETTFTQILISESKAGETQTKWVRPDSGFRKQTLRMNSK